MTDLLPSETSDAATKEPVSRRRLMAGLGSAAAAAAAVRVVGAASPADAIAVTGLVTGSAPGVAAANHVALQAAIDAAPAGATLQLPPGTFQVDITNGPVWLRRSINLVGDLGATPTVFDMVPNDRITRSFLQVEDGTQKVNGSWILSGVFRFSDFTVNGPATAYTTPYDPAVQGPEHSPLAFAIGWSVRLSTGELTVERVNITGAFAQGIERSGRGTTRIIDCNISAYISAVAIWDDANTPNASTAIISGGTHTTGSVMGSTTKYSSVGIYIHPSYELLMSDVVYENFQRFGVYTNGQPNAVPSAWTLENVTIDGCGGVIQTATHIDALVVGMKVRNGVPGQGATIKGSVTFVDCSFSGINMMVPCSNDPDTRVQFLSCWISPGTLFLAAGNGFGDGTDGLIRFEGCTVTLSGTSSLMSGTTQWKGLVELLDTEIYHCGTTTGRHVQLTGGSLYVDNTNVHSGSATPIYVAPGLPVTGAATIGPATTCPTPP